VNEFNNQLKTGFNLIPVLIAVMTLSFALPVGAQKPFAGKRGNLRERLLKIRQMRRDNNDDSKFGEFKNLSIRERMQKLRELRGGKQNSVAGAEFEQLDISYGEHARQKLDIYAPGEAKNLPVMVYFHGGAWRMGNKRMVDTKPAFFPGRNWIFVSCNYRLLPDGEHPANVQDVAAALSWVHDHIEEYGGSSDKIILCGFSAGAHLAALAAVDHSYLENCGKSLSLIEAVILLDNPVSDVIAEIEGPSRERLLQAFGDDREVHLSASPLHQVAANKKLPKFVMAYSGGLPSSSPMAEKDFKLQATTLAAAIEQAGGKAYLFPHEKLTHPELNQNFGSPDDQDNVTQPIMKLIESFL
jgi:acetyl esterase/lipase